MSQIIVLDTHVWLWLINGNLEQFPSHWKEEFETASKLGVSPVSCYEIALAHSKGRIQLPGTAKEWFDLALEPAGIELFPITENITATAVGLGASHFCKTHFENCPLR
jgi:PIN domain nuclease of toxin-antitoxin system